MKSRTIHKHAGFRSVSLMLMAALVMLPLMGASRKGKKSPRVKWEAEADQRKADYYFMEALRQNSLEDDDAYFDLLSTAWQLDSSDTNPGLHLGYYMMALGQNDSAYAAKGYNMMRRHFDAHPGDYYGAIFYGMINDRLGNTSGSVRVRQTLDSLNPDNPDVALRYAQALMNTVDSASLMKSIDVVNRIERSEGADLGLTSHKVRARMALNDTAGVLAELDNYRSRSPRDADYYIYAGKVYTAYRMNDSALASYNMACRVDSTSGAAYYSRALFFNENGDSAAFNSEVYKALQMESLDLDVKLELLTTSIREALADSTLQPRIERLFDVLLEQNPHEPKIRDLYASYLMALNRTSAAAEQQAMALDLDPSNAGRWTSTIGLYYQAEDYARSADLARRAMKYFPDDARMGLLLAGDLQQLGKWQEAVDTLRSILPKFSTEDNDGRAQALSLIGDSFHQLGLPDSAYEYYDLALLADPDNVMAANNYAYYLAVEGKDLDRAEILSSMAVRSNPDNDTFLDTYAWIFFKKKDYARAKEYIDQALELEEEGGGAEAEVLHHAGDIYYMNGEPQQALEYWEQALKLDPGNDLLKKKVRHKTHFFE